MKRYDQNFKVEALKLSDEIGVKKACEQLKGTSKNPNFKLLFLSLSGKLCKWICTY